MTLGKRLKALELEICHFSISSLKRKVNRNKGQSYDTGEEIESS